MIIFILANPTKCPVDVILVLDKSGSVGRTNWELMKSFVSELVARMDVDNQNTRVGLVCFSTDVHTEDSFNLNAHSKVASIKSAISKLTFSEGQTHTAAALRYVRTRMLTMTAGDRPHVPNVVIVLTDGESNLNETETKVCTRSGNMLRKTHVKSSHVTSCDVMSCHVMA